MEGEAAVTGARRTSALASLAAPYRVPRRRRAAGPMVPGALAILGLCNVLCSVVLQGEPSRPPVAGKTLHILARLAPSIALGHAPVGGAARRREAA